MNVVLSAAGVSVSFGGVHAVVDVDLQVDEGQIVGLIGPNGAGKTTFIDAITGFVARSGRVELDGATSPGCRRTCGRGGGSPGPGSAIELFDDLSVRENLTVAAQRPSFLVLAAGAARPSPSARAPPSTTRSSWSTSAPIAEAMPAELTQGQRKLVGVARALAMRAAAAAASTSPRPGSTRTRARVSAAGCARIADRARRCS